MIEKKIKALQDITLNTYIESHFLIKDEVKIVKFRNQKRFENLLSFGNFVEADRSEEVARSIPVIHAPIDDTVEEVEQKLPFVEPVQVHNDLDEVRELMEEETLEDRRREELPQVEEEIDYRDTTEARSTDTPDAFESEELTSEQETEGLVEVEEIPIKEQDKSKPELQLDEVVDNQSEE